LQVGENMALTSPGVEVSVINESFYVPADAGTTPLLIVATAQDKLNGAGTAVASGTKTANANQVYLISSQRELTETFGDPKFYTDASGNSLNGYELNEYGLQAAYSFLGIANRAFVLRANIDLSDLTGSSIAPTAEPTNGTYWFDLTSTVPGLFEWSRTDQAFSAINPTYITSTNDLVGGSPTGAPKTSIGKIGDYAINTTHVTNKIYYKTSSNTWVQVGSTAWKTATSGGLFSISSHTSRPQWKTADENAVTGSVWFKTTTPNAGANISVKLYSSTSGTWSTVTSPLYATNHSAIYGLDPVNGGTGLSTGDLYTQYNETEQSLLGAFDTTPGPLGSFQIFRYEGGATTIVSNDTSPSFTSGHTFYIQESKKGQEALDTKKLVTLGGDDADAFVAAVSAAGLTNVSAEVLSTGAIKITHALGGEFRMWQVTGTALDDAGFSVNTNAHDYGSYEANSSTLVDNLYKAPAGATEDSTTPVTVVASNWKKLSYTASTSEPTNEPVNGTLWYNTNLEADIMVHDGTTWKGYLQVYATTDPNGPQFSATRPTTQSDGTTLVANDLWIDTSDLENYPKIYRYDTTQDVGSEWVLMDNTDQTTDQGIVFADARWQTSAEKADSSETGGAGTASSIKDLLSDDFLDPDAPNPALYPKYILLFNTRRSGYNVKEYRNSYITSTAYPGSGSSGKGNIRYSNESVATYFPDRWVTKNANNANGSGTFGRKAVRKVIIAQLKSEINTNQAIREDQRGFNIIACPGYPEVISEMVNLNTDRNNTAFVMGDTPFRLGSSSTELTNWSNNTAGAVDNGEEGLVTSSDYLGVFYPSGRTTDNSGNSVVVPASHMMLRTFANNDNVAFPWFAPAGTRRGIVDNATAVGYIDSEGEFETIALTESVRDSMFTAKLNPITFFSGTGIVNFGNLTKTSSSSALDRINVSRLTVYLRTQLDRLAKPFIFEPNDTLTRNEIKGAVESFLLELVGQRALYDFLVVCDDTNNTPTRIDRNELYVDIAIEPVKSVEFIYIPLRIKNTGEIQNLGS